MTHHKRVGAIPGAEGRVLEGAHDGFVLKLGMYELVHVVRKVRSR